MCMTLSQGVVYQTDTFILCYETAEHKSLTQFLCTTHATRLSMIQWSHGFSEADWHKLETSASLVTHMLQYKFILLWGHDLHEEKPIELEHIAKE